MMSHFHARNAIASVTVLLCCFQAAVFGQTAAIQRGVVVEAVGQEGPWAPVLKPALSIGDSALALTEVRAGDVFLKWSRVSSPPRTPDAGVFQSIYDFSDVKVEQSPRGLVELSGTRDGAPLVIQLRLLDWKIGARPQMPERVRSAYEDGKRLVEANDVDKGLDRWLQAAEETDDSDLACWLFLRTGDVFADANRLESARDAYQRSIARAGKSGQTAALAAAQLNLGKLLQRSDPAGAEEAYRRALEIREMVSPRSLATATVLNLIGALQLTRGNFTSAEELHQKALAIQQELAPGSLNVAASLASLGILARRRGDPDTAEAFFRRAMDVHESIAPRSFVAAGTLKNLGAVAGLRGDLAGAEDFYRQALAIEETLNPPVDLDMAGSLNNLGTVAHARGDLAHADDFFRRALAIKEHAAPGSLLVAGALNNLGSVAVQRRDLEEAEDLFRRALTIVEKVAPTGIDAAAILNNLGSVVSERGDLAAAGDLVTRALAVKERLAPGSLDVAEGLDNLGDLARKRGEIGGAEELFRRALQIRESVAPASLAVAHSLHGLGDLALQRGDLASAEGLFHDASVIQEKLAPDHVQRAITLRELGVIAKKNGRTSAAAEYFSRAIDVLESQTAKLGGSDDVRSAFAAGFTDIYAEYTTLLLENARFADAFDIVERSRARTLLRMMAERDLVFSADEPGTLERDRKLLDSEYDRTQAQLAGLNSSRDGKEIQSLTAHLRDLRDRREDLKSSLRKASPSLASLQYPQPLTLAQVENTLDPGTVLLSYVVGPSETLLFVVRSNADRKATGNVAVFHIKVERGALQSRIAEFRELVQSPVATTRTKLMQRGRELYALLVAPADAPIRESDRVLISPDGPLHVLPFGVLVAGNGEYFIQRKPIHTVISATVYAELQKTRRENKGQLRMAAFGDPSYLPIGRADSASFRDAETGLAVKRGLKLQPLPASRDEVNAIAQLYGTSATVYLAEEATEERAKALGKEVRYIHFAVHGLLDERFPLNSALALTMPKQPVDGQDNGLLQVWEIFERMRIDADLVTLSACETALGKDMGGEGLVGLTRAFQYAGAHSILAALWSVADESTAMLMKGFYRNLTAGKTKDQALRTAQLDLIQSKGAFSHPFYWASFELIGDWK